MVPTPTHVLYHHPCADGFASALVLFRHFCTTEQEREINFIGVNYDKPVNVVGLGLDRSRSVVYFVDFFPGTAALEAVARSAKTVVVLDHHKTAMDDVMDLTVASPDWMANVHLNFDMDRSGAGMTYDWLHGILDRDARRHHPEPRPKLVDHVEDRDLWRFDLFCTREIVEVLFSHDYDFHTWAGMWSLMETEQGYETLLSEGKALMRAKRKNIDEWVDRALQWWDFDIAPELEHPTQHRVDGYTDVPPGMVRVPVLNIPYQFGSEAADVVLARFRGAPFYAYYMDKPDFRRQWGLRSRGQYDVSAIAKARGGGGHRNAAGFQQRLIVDGEN